MEEVVLMTKEDIGICKNIFALAFDIICLTDNIETFSDDNKKLLNMCRQLYDVPRYFNKCIDDVDKYAYCIKDEGCIIGFITGWKIPSVSYPYSIYIDMIAITPEHQGKGYGTKLLEYFIKNIAQDILVCLVTEPNSPAYKMYSNLGFSDEKTTRMNYSKISQMIKKYQSEVK